MTRRCLTAALGGVVALSLVSAVAQEDEKESDEPLRCLSMNSISRGDRSADLSPSPVPDVS